VVRRAETEEDAVEFPAVDEHLHAEDVAVPVGRRDRIADVQDDVADAVNVRYDNLLIAALSILAGIPQMTTRGHG
jgi:hypothetical protein